MYTFFTILIVLASILVVLLVLMQNSKGGGLAAGFQSGNQVMGAPKTADFLEKATWTLIAVVVLLSIAAVGFHKHAAADVKEIEVSEKAAEEMDLLQQQTATPDFSEPAEEAEAE